ncbi:dNTP triphosphohydrolase [Candidatus Gracilibacteria bacterium]|nr:dNTP triphosphohydrolase [Candidatus Gracilibacteria bacterium]
MSKETLDGAFLATQFDSQLAPYAQHNTNSRGRRYSEIPDPSRIPFQRDRDRIIHTKAFRRLKGKMQVVSPLKGDHFRNRLSHTLEVSQIARDLARSLQLNEDLAEAIALAHDLGHPPFGHSGEGALNKKMKEHKSHFEHNEQSLRVVEVFESRYQEFPGLNLTFEVLEGIQKHETFFDRGDGKKILWPHLEGQLVDIADEIAYLSADLEDGLRGGFFKIPDLSTVEIPSEAIATLDTSEKKDRSAIIRRIIRHLLSQIISDTKENLKKHNIHTLSEVQQCPEKIVAFAPAFFEKFKSFKQFLWDKYYLSSEIRENADRGKKIISEIFDFLFTHQDEIPSDFMKGESIERRICDYIAGMTDEFAERFWGQLTINNK